MKKILLSCLTLLSAIVPAAGMQTEKLDRGVIAVKTSSGVFVSWRSLTSDAPDMTFDVYRDGNVKVNDAPIKGGTNFKDNNGSASSTYVVKALMGNEVVESSKVTNVEPDVYKRIKLDRPAGGIFEGNAAIGGTDEPITDEYDYVPNDCSVGDVDGDGEYEIFVKWNPSNARDNSHNGITGNVYIDCYKLDGTKLWRIDLGRNIRAGAHYTQFMVYDFDGDGRAELACKTAPGTIDGKGKYVVMGSDDPTKSYVNNRGHVISGPEYLTMFDGETGAEISTVAFNPPRSIRTPAQWGAVQTGTKKSDETNRPERYLAAVAYLDGEKPSLIMCRGYYTASYVCAWDFDGKTLKQRWLHKSETANQGLYGEGAHSLTVGDVDGDGCDEIVYGSACLDHDGSVLYTTRGGHGDALHLGDFLPDRPGLEVFMVHEEKDKAYPFDAEVRDAATGEIIWKKPNSKHDIGRGLAGDISPNWRGYEFWCEDWTTGKSRKVVYGTEGQELSTKQYDTNFRVYWDGDLLDELFDGRYDKGLKVYNPRITKPNAKLDGTAKTWTVSSMSATAQKAYACNTTKATPCLSADIFGDWREEIILWDGATGSDLLIYTTTIDSKYRVPCLMEDHNYRMAIAWQNVGYNQPPHLGYYLADRFSNEPRVKVTSGPMGQTVELGKSIEKIEGSFEKCDDLKASGLPGGVTLSVDAVSGTFCIEGAPESTGTFKYTIASVGGEGSASAEGTITVIEPVVLTEVAHFSFDALGAAITNHVEGAADVKGAPVLTEGMFGNALRFDGANDYLEQAAYDRLQMGYEDFTIEMWFNSDDDAAYILHKGSITKNEAAGHTGHWFGIELKKGNLYFAIDDNDEEGKKSQVTLSNAAGYFNGQWHHLVCTRSYSSKELSIYMDGVAVASGVDATGAIRDNNEPLCIGNVNVNHDNFFKGAIDDLHIYHGAMTASTVRERYEAATKSGIYGIGAETGSDPVRYILIDASTGMTVSTALGSADNVTAGAVPGVYLLVSEQGGVRTVSKIVL